MGSALEFAVQLSKQTGELLMRIFNPSGIPAALKADKTFVTEADLAADQLIADAIGRQYPQDAILSEELQPVLDRHTSAVWIVDPLDGTTNFSLGLPIWGISIARLEAEQLVCAAIYFPTLGELYSAQLNVGAWFNGEPLRPAPPVPGRTASFFACCTRTYRHFEVGLKYKCRILGSAAYTWCTVARGIAAIGFEVAPKIWDIAGGWLIVREAGGVADSYNDPAPFPLSPGLDYRQRNFPTLMAATPELLDKARQQIRPRSAGPSKPSASLRE